MYLAMINIHNNMYHSINLYKKLFILLIHPFIGMVLISASLLLYPVFSLLQFSLIFQPLKNQYWSPYTAMNDSRSPTIFYHNWSYYPLTT